MILSRPVLVLLDPPIQEVPEKRLILGGRFAQHPDFYGEGPKFPGSPRYYIRQGASSGRQPAQAQLCTLSHIYAFFLLFQMSLQLLYLAEAPLVGADLRPETEVSHVVSQCASSLAW